MSLTLICLLFVLAMLTLLGTLALVVLLIVLYQKGMLSKLKNKLLSAFRPAPAPAPTATVTINRAAETECFSAFKTLYSSSSAEQKPKLLALAPAYFKKWLEGGDRDA